jgi:hypothetical protein
MMSRCANLTPIISPINWRGRGGGESKTRYTPRHFPSKQRSAPKRGYMSTGRGRGGLMKRFRQRSPAVRNDLCVDLALRHGDDNYPN